MVISIFKTIYAIAVNIFVHIDFSPFQYGSAGVFPEVGFQSQIERPLLPMTGFLEGGPDLRTVCQVTGVFPGGVCGGGLSREKGALEYLQAACGPW